MKKKTRSRQLVAHKHEFYIVSVLDTIVGDVGSVVEEEITWVDPCVDDVGMRPFAGPCNRNKTLNTCLMLHCPLENTFSKD